MKISSRVSRRAKKATGRVYQRARTKAMGTQTKANPDATLREAFDAFLASRPLSAETVRQYKAAINRSYVDWLGRRLSDLTQPEIVNRADEVHREAPGLAFAGYRVLSAVFEFHNRGTLRENPAKGIHDILSARIRQRTELRKVEAVKKPEKTQSVEVPKPTVPAATSSSAAVAKTKVAPNSPAKAPPIKPLVEVLPPALPEKATAKLYNLSIQFVATELADVTISFKVG
ncbi:MAG: hypothetical protein JSS83_17460 [Cyanobacteria bacterium SZAS LIN-3]|nr:hypothetical protein [Cyanobacteria bacterium SZAS LIN-3]